MPATASADAASADATATPGPTPGIGHGLDVLEALHRYRAADSAHTRRRRTLGGMSETELVAVLHLVRAGRDGDVVGAGELAAHLSISAASTTQLIDRLEEAGLVERLRNPADRRSILVSAVHIDDADLRVLLTGTQPELLVAANALGAEQAAVVARFLDEIVGLIEHDRPVSATPVAAA